MDGMVNAALAVNTTSPVAASAGGNSDGDAVPSGAIHPDAASVVGWSTHAPVPGSMTGVWFRSSSSRLILDPHAEEGAAEGLGCRRVRDHQLRVLGGAGLVCC